MNQKDIRRRRGSAWWLDQVAPPRAELNAGGVKLRHCAECGCRIRDFEQICGACATDRVRLGHQPAAA